MNQQPGTLRSNRGGGDRGGSGGRGGSDGNREWGVRGGGGGGGNRRWASRGGGDRGWISHNSGGGDRMWGTRWMRWRPTGSQPRVSALPFLALPAPALKAIFREVQS